MEKKVSLSGLFPEEIAKAIQLSPLFRAKQIYEWISKGAESFEQMTNIDKTTRKFLEENVLLRSSKVTEVLKDPDGTIKLQISLSDGLAIETVLLTDKEGRKTACVSCQAGCAMGCAFCQTGRLGLGRNLTAGEIVEEFFFMEKEAGTLDNIVFMGMGEPLQKRKRIKPQKNHVKHLRTYKRNLRTCGKRTFCAPCNFLNNSRPSSPRTAYASFKRKSIT